jgi:hypothetical protein
LKTGFFYGAGHNGVPLRDQNSKRSDVKRENQRRNKIRNRKRKKKEEG